MISYDDAIKLITSKGRFYVDFGLDRIRSALKKLGNPQEGLQYIHVAGTNGKGSVCTMLDSVLREAGYKTGLYTSPHIWEYTERIRVNGISISKEVFAQYVEKICSLDIHLTEFEILTIMAFLYFKESNVDIVILETGMGGRLDATNVIEKNLCAVITQIDLDHTDKLGDTKDKIAFEKAGIIKPNCPVVTSMGYEPIRDKADECNSMFIMVSPFVEPKFVEALSLKGIHQRENLALVLTVINYLFKDISEETIIQGLKRVKNPCRFQYIEGKNLIIDASHNPNGISMLRENLDLYYPDEQRRFVFGCLNTKDYEKMMNILFKEGDEVYLYEFNYPNVCTYDELSKVCPIASKPYNSFVELTPDKLNIICGSFYMIGEMKELQSVCII